jgi:sugar phosphate isomerase/epimerase
MVELGFKTWNIFYNGKDKIDLPTLEIASKDPDFGFRRKSLELIKNYLKGKSLSMHTQTKRLFTEKSKVLRELEVKTLSAEILACSYLGCKELIVHLTQSKLSSDEVKQLRKLIKFAKQNKVQLLYEPNGDFNGQTFLYNVGRFRDLNVNLDLCHLAMAVENKTLNMELFDFLFQIRDKVVYVHASGYDGKTEHVGLSNGTLDWKVVLSKLDMKKVKKIIIELHNLKHFNETKKQLELFTK